MPVPHDYDEEIEALQEEIEALQKQLEEQKQNAPYIGENGNWYVNGQDTGVPAQGPKGDDGKNGKDGTNGKDGESSSWKKLGGKSLTLANVSITGINVAVTGISQTYAGISSTGALLSMGAYVAQSSIAAVKTEAWANKNKILGALTGGVGALVSVICSGIKNLATRNKNDAVDLTVSAFSNMS